MADRIILAVNAGSSSLKVSAYRQVDKTEVNLHKLADVQISGIASEKPQLSYSRGGEQVEKDTDIKSEEAKDQISALKHILDLLASDSSLNEIESQDSFSHVVHRIVHGGTFSSPQRLDGSTLEQLEALSDLAPLHNGPALSLVKAVHERLPKAKSLAAFDSAFHASIPAHISIYPLDREVAQKNGLRKYGFHGLSYAFITRSVAAHLSKPSDQLNVLALHLGSGASACAIRQGASLDTSMGLTPASGLPGGTRSGSIDPAAIFHYTHSAGKMSSKSSEKIHVTQAEEILNAKSGFKGLTGTNDFGEIAGQLSKPEMRLAFDLFVDRILNFVGAYWLKLGGEVDALVFAGGIGEKSAELRAEIVKAMACFGVEVDDAKNQSPAEETVADIGSAKSKTRVLVVQTDEQLEMAREVVVFESSKS